MRHDVAISAAALGKQYRLGELGLGYDRLTEVVAQRIKRRRAVNANHRREFWALRDVTFEVEPGDSVGIIGHNGAGKSTLLKILARITSPSEGEVRLRGRVGALLEVGTGFHPDLTGRQNVYLNGAVLGMRKAEIDARFEEIVSFAEVETFIDTPVKRYSTGMGLRLAFAVAAHLEPEILIVDEVLSVGDLAFQEKCLGRMDEVASEGRTVLFVSHNLTAVRHFCQRCILLSAGRKIAEGAPDDVIDAYTRSVRGDTQTRLADLQGRQGSGRLRFQEVILQADGQVIDSPSTGQSFNFILRYETLNGKPLRNVTFALWLTTVTGQTILLLSSHETGTLFREVPGAGEVRCTLPRCPVPAGQYAVTLWADIGGEPLDWVDPAFQLTVRAGDFFGSGQATHERGQSVLVDHSWSVARTGAGTDAAASPRDSRKWLGEPRTQGMAD
jgi:lipopolysaccharide transport system ATP-binding protein